MSIFKILKLMVCIIAARHANAADTLNSTIETVGVTVPTMSATLPLALANATVHPPQIFVNVTIAPTLTEPTTLPSVHVNAAVPLPSVIADTTVFPVSTERATTLKLNILDNSSATASDDGNTTTVQRSAGSTPAILNTLNNSIEVASADGNTTTVPTSTGLTTTNLSTLNNLIEIASAGGNESNSQKFNQYMPFKVILIENQNNTDDEESIDFTFDDGLKENITSVSSQSNNTSIKRSTSYNSNLNDVKLIDQISTNINPLFEAMPILPDTDHLNHLVEDANNARRYYILNQTAHDANISLSSLDNSTSLGKLNLKRAAIANALNGAKGATEGADVTAANLSRQHLINYITLGCTIVLLIVKISIMYACYFMKGHSTDSMMHAKIPLKQSHHEDSHYEMSPYRTTVQSPNHVVHMNPLSINRN